MTNYFFARYRPEICCGLHKLCCERILRCFRSFRAKKNFPRLPIFWLFLHIRVHRFLEKWLTTFLRNTGLKFVMDCTIVLRTNFKAFKVVSSEKIFFKNWKFFDFFAYPGSQISWKMTNFFFERYWPEIFWGLQKWCCERIIRRFGSFRAKKIFFKNLKFFDFFAYPGSQISWKMTNFFFERYRPEIFSWTAQMVLRTNYKAFWLVSSEKKFFQKFEIFWLFLHIRDHRFLEKWPTSFLRDTGLKFFVDCTNGVAKEF